VRYHVFIEGSRDTTSAGVEILAGALGQRYGMSPPTVVRRLKEGRFCARASLDLAAAQRLVGELEALGAHASLVGDGAPMPLGPRYESGLSAAFGDRPRDQVSLGALDPLGDDGTDKGWQLTSVDGADGERAPTARSGPPPPPVPAAAKRAAGPTPPVTAPAPTHAPPPTIFAPTSSPSSPTLVTATAASMPPGADPFQPPGAGSDAPLELADQPTRVVAAPPPPSASRTDPPPAGVVAGATFRRPSLSVSLGERLVDSARARFVAGLALAFFVGLLPALGFAWSRSDSVYDDIRAELQADYAAADTPERWATLAAVREDALSLARARQRRLAISSCLLWLAAAGAVAFVWFRVIDWPREPDRA